MKEWHRTVVLVLLLAVAIGVIIWLRFGLEDNAVQTLSQAPRHLV